MLIMLASRNMCLALSICLEWVFWYTISSRTCTYQVVDIMSMPSSVCMLVLCFAGCDSRGRRKGWRGVRQ